MSRRFFNKIRQTAQAALRDESGAMAVFLGAGIIVLSAAVGISVDAIRGYLLQSRLSSALDAAGLAGARVMYSPTRDDDIRMYFESNFPPGFMGATVDGPNFSTVEQNDEVLTLSASATIETSFMRILGFETLTVSSTSEITRQTELLEVVLAMDMSGSMGWDAPGPGSDTRIEAARAAAKEMVEILFGDDETKPLLKIGIVPWNGKVNITRNGTTFDFTQNTVEGVDPFFHPITGVAQSIVHNVNNSPVPLLSAPPDGWKGCVFMRFWDDDIDNDADTALGPIRGVNGKDWPAWEFIHPDQGEPISPGKCPMAVDDNECTPCLSHGITALQSDKSDTIDAINELTNPKGTTNIPGGLAWGWRVLMPDAPFTEAEVDPPGRRTQAIVLLTDGENYGGSGDGYKTVFGYGSAAQGTEEDPGADDRLRQVANAIKAEGVLIYAIQFANAGTDLQTLMKQVASGEEAPFYQYAPDSDALKQVFKEVANDLSQLRISR